MKNSVVFCLNRELIIKNFKTKKQKLFEKKRRKDKGKQGRGGERRG